MKNPHLYDFVLIGKEYDVRISSPSLSFSIGVLTLFTNEKLKMDIIGFSCLFCCLCLGPGCSSMGGGAFTELGPFFPNGDGRSLRINSKSWNKGRPIKHFLLSIWQKTGFSRFADGVLASTSQNQIILLACSRSS